MKKPFLASLATVALAFSGVVSGVSPANAVYNIDDSLRYSNVQRAGSPAIVGNNIVASTTLFANEVLTGFSFTTDFASVGSPLVVTTGQALASTTVLTNTTTSATITGSNTDPQVQWTKTDNTSGVWRVWEQLPLPTGTFKKFEVSAGKYVNTSVAGNYTATSSVTLAGTALTPLSLVSNSYSETPGFRVTWNGGLSYTPNALDSRYNVSSAACFWPGDHTITSNTVLNVSYDNLDQTTNTGFAASNYAYFSGNDGSSGMNAYWNPQEIETNEVWSSSLSTLLSGIDAVSIRANASVTSPTANAIRPVFKAWLDNNTSVNVLDSCSRYESFAAPTLAPATSTTATLSWTAPTTAHASGWNDIGVYACLETNTTCATGFENPWDMSPNSPITYDFELMSMGPISGTQATISAMMMMDSAMMMGPSSSPRRQWSTSGSYKYFVVYRNMNASGGYVGLSASSAAVTAGGVASTPSTPSVSAPSAPSEPVLKGFTGHNVAKTTQKTFALDASGLTGTPEVLLNGQKLTYVKDAKGMLAIELPKTLKRGGSYDLVVSSPEGLVTVMGAIVVSADLPITKNTPSAFKGTSTALSASQVRNIRALVTASEVGDTVTCTAYVSGATTDEIAKARATSACAAATAVNPELKTVIRTAPAIFSVRNKVRVVIG